MDKNRIRGASDGRAGYLPRSPDPSRVRSVDSAAVHRRRLNLPQEICSVSLLRLRLSKGGLTAGQKSAEGILGHDVGKASEALRMPKGGATDRPSRERWLKARTRRSGQQAMSLTDGTQKIIQMQLDFSVALACEAQETKAAGA